MTTAPDLDVARDRIRGSLLAGAVGDALGAPVEFALWSEIRDAHGPRGVTGYLPAYDRAGGAITDDTQMTLFTAEGLIRSYVRYRHRGIGHPCLIVPDSYRRWLTTQGEPWPEGMQRPSDRAGHARAGDGWLMEVTGLHSRRAPGNTCLSALSSGRTGTMEDPINASKGCGGVMRVGPVGFARTLDPFHVGAECAAFTHGHPSGYLPAGFLASVVASVFHGSALGPALDAATAELRRYAGHEETLAAVERARDLAARGRPTPPALESLGGGWTGEEALAIALCCVLAGDGVVDGLLLAVNHSGDSDSTGSIAGTILGTVHGEAALPADVLGGLELRDVITEVADDLADAFYGEGPGSEYAPVDERVERWFARYPGW